MGNKYIVFDVETPNHANDRISGIGITIVENGRIAEDFGTLVDPETEFDPFNIALTGITPESVGGKPTFSELWQKIAPIMDSGLLIAHNAQFDMSVLGKCLQYYGIAWRDFAEYACTCRMGRICVPDAENHKLNTLCCHFGIPLEHHRAESDSHACAELLLRYMDRGMIPEAYRRRYDLHMLRTERDRCR